LPPEFAVEENRLIDSDDQSGTMLAGLWLRRL
jgi:hypothetical protein